MTRVKTVRFTQVVERSGKPHVHTLWIEPERDPEFKRARDAHRVMTVGRSGAEKTDTGVIGLDPARARTGQLLVFPKSLQSFAGARVIGIKFDLVEQPKGVAAPASIPPPERRKGGRVSKKSPPPAPPPASRPRRSRLPLPVAGQMSRNT